MPQIVPNMNGSTGYVSENLINNSQVKSANAGQISPKEIRSVEALNKAELQGRKLSPGDEQFIKTIDRALKAMEGPSTSVERSVHQQTNTIVIKVMDKTTGELIREIPPEKILDMITRFMEMNGMIVDEKV